MMELQTIENRTERIIECHRGISGSMRQALEYAIEAGKLLAEQKEQLKHGDFLPWIKTHMPFSRMTATKYINLFAHQDKCKSALHLQEAYQIIDKIEKQQNQTEQQKAFKRVDSYIKTGVKEEGWRRGTDDKLVEEEIKRNERIKVFNEKIDIQKDKDVEHKADYKNKWDSINDGLDYLNEAAEQSIQRNKKRQTFKEKIKLSQFGESDIFIDALMDYLNELENDNRRIEACQNIIKVCKNIAVKLQVDN